MSLLVGKWEDLVYKILKMKPQWHLAKWMALYSIAFEIGKTEQTVVFLTFQETCKQMNCNYVYRSTLYIHTKQ